MREFATNDQENYYSGITSITVNGKNAYELKGKFVDDLHNNAFNGTNREDAVKHIEYFLRIVDPIDLPYVNHGKLRVVVFPISLVRGEMRWFDEIKGSIDSWVDLTAKFFGKYYLIWKSHPKQRPNEVWSLDALLQDQACVRTRSSSSNLVSKPSTNPKRRNRRRSKQRVEPFSLEEDPVVTMADQRTMAELLQAPTEGYGDAIVIPAILAENFELKHGLLNLVTAKQFCGFEKEDPHAHIRWFNKITSTMKYKDVPNMFDEAWERFKDLLRACPHHGFTELHQLDTFYNALNPTDQDSLNAATGGNLLTKTPRDALTIIENKSKVRNLQNKPVVTRESMNAPSSSTPHYLEIAALADAVKALVFQKSSPPASEKAVEQICVTCGGPDPYH
ncbi:hypothetical protein Tco_1383131 [Tanacetum coccineum]